MATLSALLLVALIICSNAQQTRRNLTERSINSPVDPFRDRFRKQPNIIYIMADDLGWHDVGFHNSKINTPNIDSLRNGGIELTQAYMQPLCSPSRSSFMTGLYPSNNGLQQYVVLSNSKSCLPIEHKTIFEYMKDEGYVTKYAGKWHLGYCNTTCLPNSRGVDEFRGVLAGSVNYFNWSTAQVLHRNIDGEPSDVNIGTHLTIKDTRDVREMIASHQGNRAPLFMWITPTAPHDPLQVTEEMFNTHPFLDASDSETRQRREFLGLVSALDDLVGETMSSLRAANMHRNTVIVFSSDNGGAAITPEINNAQSYANNYPLRNGKYAFTEGGVKTPTIYHDPRLRRQTRGSTRDFLMHVTDWLPTFVQLGSLSNQRFNSNFRIQGIDGVSQVANLGSFYNSGSRRKYNRREDMLVALTSMDFRDYGCSTSDAAYRWKDYKLIYGKKYYHTDPDTIPTEWKKPEESPELPDITGDDCHRTVDGERVVRCLFNVVDDPSETCNLFDGEPEIVAKLLEMIENAKRESVRPAFSPNLGVNRRNTQTYKDYIVPRHDYCDPAIHSPLVSNFPHCS